MGRALMLHGEPVGHTAQACVGPDTMILNGKPVSLLSDVGALALLHGALQSSIASVDDACNAEIAYKQAMLELRSKR